MLRTHSENWKIFLSNPTRKYIFILTLVIFIVALNQLEKFLIFIESRKGVVLDDPLFRHFLARDFNTPIFIIIYGSLIIALIALLPHPRYLMLALQTFIIMIFFRMIVMYVTPLEVPDACINLKDPFVFSVGTGCVITKDLFFSGHVATLTILFLTARNKYLKYIFLVLTLILIILILLQKNHYTIDVLSAPFFVFGAWSIGKRIDERVFRVSLR
jgi:hypothetical protein